MLEILLEKEEGGVLLRKRICHVQGYLLSSVPDLVALFVFVGGARDLNHVDVGALELWVGYHDHVLEIEEERDHQNFLLLGTITGCDLIVVVEGNGGVALVIVQVEVGGQLCFPDLLMIDEPLIDLELQRPHRQVELYAHIQLK